MTSALFDTQVSRATRPSPALRRLREATATAHRRLEGRLALESPAFTRASYPLLIAALHGFYVPLERRLAALAPGIESLRWPERIKAPRLAADLHALGMDAQGIAGLPLAESLPTVSSPAATLGCLYVTEGSTLGAQVVRSILRARFGTAFDGALAFLTAYGGDAGRQWGDFLHCLARLHSPEEIDAATEAGVETFATLESWLERNEVLA